jgi:UDP-GlcNAc3NAcA epimerase
MTKLLTVIGARPQFIKAATVSRKIRNLGRPDISEVLVHTGQHYDEKMSTIFFNELDIPAPNYNLGISDLSHGAMTGRMLEEVERVILNEAPDWVLVYGDTNSTLAGALAAAKLHVPVAHVEAGLRSFNMRMPEEINRIISDRVSKLLFCPTGSAIQNLAAEGITTGVHDVGDVMYDAILHYGEKAAHKSNILHDLKLKEREFVLVTCHRQENTDDPIRMAKIITELSRISNDLPVIFPMHPRTRKRLMDYGLNAALDCLQIADPVSYLDMIALEKGARMIVTDSGGVQKEAYFLGVPCVTMRNETEWVETVTSGWNRLVGVEEIVAGYESQLKFDICTMRPEFYGDGSAADKILNAIENAQKCRLSQ